MTTAPVDRQDSVLYAPDGKTPLAGVPSPNTPPTYEWRPVQQGDNATVWEKAPQQSEDAEQLVAAAKAEAARIISGAEADARQMVEKAKKNAGWAAEEVKERQARTINAAEAEAKGIRERAEQVLEDARQQTQDRLAKKERRDQQIDAWSPRIALAAVIGLTASGEFSLAVLAGWPPPLAWLLPLGIDVYVVQAMRRHRDVVIALLLMVAANAVFHVAAAGLFGVILGPTGEPVIGKNGDPKATWQLIVGVAAIAPWVMFRLHRITTPKADKPRRWRRAEKPQTSASVDNTTASTDRQDAAPVDNSSPELSPATSDNWRQEAPTTGDSNSRELATTGAPSWRQEAPAKAATTGDNNAAKSSAKKPAELATTTARKAPAKRSAAGAKKAATPKRRSADEWVELATPIFRSEFARLRRNPTASEFATAIKAAGLGNVSDSTAKNIRTEILDRAELPALD